jgi:hypothetical protein
MLKQFPPLERMSELLKEHRGSPELAMAGYLMECGLSRPATVEMATILTDKAMTLLYGDRLENASDDVFKNAMKRASKFVVALVPAGMEIGRTAMLQLNQPEAEPVKEAEPQDCYFNAAGEGTLLTWQHTTDRAKSVSGLVPLDPTEAGQFHESLMETAIGIDPDMRNWSATERTIYSQHQPERKAA